MHGMYEELCGAVVTDTDPPVMCCLSNPFKLVRKRFKVIKGSENDSDGPEASGVAKAISDEAWEAVWKVAGTVPPDTKPAARARLARRRLVIAMLRATWERRHAVASIRWSDLKRDRDGGWSARRERKGKGAEWAPVPDSVVGEINEFRKILGRPPFPTNDELQRSIFWLGGRTAGHDGPVSDETIYRAVKEVFNLAAAALDTQDRKHVAAELRRVGSGPHTVRHTMATQFMAGGGEARIAQKILGHSSIAVTTRVYDTKSVTEEREALEAQWRGKRDIAPAVKNDEAHNK